MRNEHVVKQTIQHRQKQKAKRGEGHKLHWWQLSLIGIGSIIGAGFFLGTGLSIERAGPSVLIDYLIAGIVAFLVFSAFAEMSVHDKETGSFRKYAQEAFGRPLGFMSGWMYWISGILIMASEITALALFTQYWFPAAPLWLLMVLYTATGIGINLLGVRNFGTIESLFAVVKIATLIGFIVFGLLYLFHFIHPVSSVESGGVGFSQWFPHGAMGSWTALIFVLFSFGGIAVVGLMSSELEDKNDTPKSGIAMVIALAIIYILSLFFIVSMVTWAAISEDESPFVTALSVFHVPYIGSLFNIILITAAFSTMVGAMFSVTKVIVSLGRDGDAPSKLAKFNKKGVAVRALGLNGFALGVMIFISYILPDKVYEYLTTAAGIMLLLNWVVILASQIKTRSRYEENPEKKTYFKMLGAPFSSYLGIALIAFAIAGAWFQDSERIGLLISIAIIMIIFAGYFGAKKFAGHHLE
ncbi:amino acid permease [Pseudalkalibacillus caeni]|uniref:Amino acid permease n=1 Tax=Exobacillus caeni TaxID=2574798 RepID=A0A5R9F350_9BACL|nr:amino acid permease [Pseudalkalibacillus caeni]TLS38112.1 amino acid permease [Pseudalkalibacillus caeni]